MYCVVTGAPAEDESVAEGSSLLSASELQDLLQQEKQKTAALMGECTQRLFWLLLISKASPLLLWFTGKGKGNIPVMVGATYI